MEIIKRTECAAATLAHYQGARSKWGDCVRMAARHLRNMGHTVALAKAGEFRSEATADRALARMGFDSVEAAFDARFERIAPAAAVVGDILALPSESRFPALCVHVGNGNVLHLWKGGYAVSIPKLFVAAWRIPCLKV